MNDHVGFGRWAFIEVTDPMESASMIEAVMSSAPSTRRFWKPGAVKIHEGLEVDDDRLADICRRFRIRELHLFGSVLRDDFRPDSDVDVLYVGEPHLSGEPWAIVAFAQELEDLFGRRVDVVGKDSVHWYIRERVLSEARPMYAA